MKKQLIRSLSFLFCLSSTLLSCGGQSTPSINSTEEESETISSSEEVNSVSTENPEISQDNFSEEVSSESSS